MKTRRRIASLVAICFALASVPSVGLADQSGGGSDSKVAEGEALAEQAFNLYKEGRYNEAVAAYQRAYELAGSSIILFNIANLYDRKLRQLDQAAEYYRRYVRTPDASPDFVRKANERLDAIRQQAATTPAAPAPSTAAPAPEGPSSSPPPPDGEPDPAWRTAGLALGGLGLVSLGVSTAFALRARGKEKDADEFCKQRECADPRGIDLGDQALSAARVSTYTFAGGLVGLVGGAVLYFAAPTRSTTSTTARSLRVGPSAQMAGLVLSGAWLQMPARALRALCALACLVGTVSCEDVLGIEDRVAVDPPLDRWSCLFSTPPTVVEQEVTFYVFDLFASSSLFGPQGPTGPPVVNATLRVCPSLDDECRGAVGTPTTTDAGGMATLKVPPGFNGYVEVQTDTSTNIDEYIPQLVYDDRLRTLAGPRLLRVYLLNKRLMTTYVNGAFKGKELDPMLGYTYLEVHDCQGVLSSGIAFEVVPATSSGIPYYALNGGPDPTLQETNYGGGGFINMPPGRTRILSKLAAAGVQLNDSQVLIRAGWNTQMVVGPAAR
jgi:hypothetical protein